MNSNVIYQVCHDIRADNFFCNFFVRMNIILCNFFCMNVINDFGTCVYIFFCIPSLSYSFVHVCVYAYFEYV